MFSFRNEFRVQKYVETGFWNDLIITEANTFLTLFKNEN